MVSRRPRHAGPGRARARGLKAAVVGLLAAAAAAAAAQEPPATTADSLGGQEVPPELQDVVAELEQADQPLPWQDLGLALAEGAAPPRAAGVPAMAWRSGAAPGGGRHDARLDLDSRRWGAQGALRIRPDLAPEAGGAARLRIGAVDLWAGHLALRHGFGLTGQAPGRRGSLAADEGFGGVSGGLAARTASGAGAGGVQAAAELVRGSWRLAGAGGLPGRVGAGPLWAGRVERDDGRSRLALTAGADTGGVHAGAAGRLERSPLTVCWELARLLPADGSRELAMVTALTWRANARLRLELMAGLADGPGRGATAVLPAGARRGWAARLAWRDRATGALELLAQGSTGALAQTAARRRSAAVLEAVWERRTLGALTVHLRCRRTARTDFEWSPREPWLPATSGEPLLKTSLSAGLHRDSGGLRAAVQWRSLSVTGGATRGNRQLLALSANRRWPGGWEAWCDIGAAWGENVDLVRALVPLPGQVTARHWGAWRSETCAGAGRRWGPLQVHAAVAQRWPETTAPASGRAVWEAWLRARTCW